MPDNSACNISIVGCIADHLICQLLQPHRRAPGEKLVMRGCCRWPSKQNQIFSPASGETPRTLMDMKYIDWGGTTGNVSTTRGTGAVDENALPAIAWDGESPRLAGRQQPVINRAQLSRLFALQFPYRDVVSHAVRLGLLLYESLALFASNVVKLAVWLITAVCEKGAITFAIFTEGGSVILLVFKEDISTIG